MCRRKNEDRGVQAVVWAGCGLTTRVRRTALLEAVDRSRRFLTLTETINEACKKHEHCFAQLSVCLSVLTTQPSSRVPAGSPNISAVRKRTVSGTVVLRRANFDSMRLMHCKGHHVCGVRRSACGYCRQQQRALHTRTRRWRTWGRGMAELAGLRERHLASCAHTHTSLFARGSVSRAHKHNGEQTRQCAMLTIDSGGET